MGVIPHTKVHTSESSWTWYVRLHGQVTKAIKNSSPFAHYYQHRTNKGLCTTQAIRNWMDLFKKKFKMTNKKKPIIPLTEKNSQYY